MHPKVDMLEMKATFTMTEAATRALGTRFPKRGKKNKRVLNIYNFPPQYLNIFPINILI